MDLDHLIKSQIFYFRLLWPPFFVCLSSTFDRMTFRKKCSPLTLLLFWSFEMVGDWWSSMIRGWSFFWNNLWLFKLFLSWEFFLDKSKEIAVFVWMVFFLKGLVRIFAGYIFLAKIANEKGLLFFGQRSFFYKKYLVLF